MSTSMESPDNLSLLKLAAAAGDRDKVKKVLALLHQEIREQGGSTALLSSTLEELYQRSQDSAICTEIKRLQNRIRSKRLLGSDLLRLTSPPLNDVEQEALWHDLQALQETYEAGHGHQSFSQKYEVFERIGEGGMSIVFRGLRKSDELPVAIKFLRKEFFRSAAVSERFRRECEIIPCFDHPHIIRVHEAGEYMGGGYLVMDYHPLRGVDTIIQDERFTVKLVVEVVKQVAEALQEIHSQGVVHRDVKLSNLLLADYAPEQNRITVKICDFGICKPLGAEGLTRVGTVMETQFYSAPEQRESPATVDQRADIYSFGVVLYRMLSRKYYPQGSYPLLKELVPRLPKEIDTLVQRCLAHDPAGRPASMQLVLSELKLIQEKMTV